MKIDITSQMYGSAQPHACRNEDTAATGRDITDQEALLARVRQAERLASWLKERGRFDALYSSPLRRAVQTAETLRHVMPSLPAVQIVPGLQEADYHLLEVLRRVRVVVPGHLLWVGAGRRLQGNRQALRDELAAYPAPADGHAPEPASVVVPLRIRTAHGELSFLSTTTVFGTPVEVTLSELAIEAFFPADRETAEKLRGLMG